MQNFIQRGDTIAIPAPADLVSGAGVLVGSFFGAATTDALEGALVECQVEGIVALAKAAGAWTAGMPVFWDDAEGLATADDDTGGNARIGVAVAAAADAATTGHVKLLGQAI